MTTSTTPTTKTLDLAAHAATFSSTYEHARRMGADRPLSHRFALADVLGKIEKEIAKRVSDAVAREKLDAAATARRVSIRHAQEVVAARARTAPTSERFVLHRGPFDYAVRDQLTGQLAPFSHLGAAEGALRQLLSGTARPERFGWLAH